MTLTRRHLLTAACSLAGTAAGVAQGAGSVAPGDAVAPPLPKPGARLALPDVSLLDGSRFRARSADGQVLVVYWWASWCPFCAVQSPHVDALWKSQRTRGLQLLALSVDQQRDNAANYMRRKGYSFPAGMVTPEVATILPKPKGLPVTLVRGRDGTVVFAEAGEMFPEDIEGLAKFL